MQVNSFTLAKVKPMVPVPQQMSRTVVVVVAPHQSAICSYKTSAPAVFTVKQSSVTCITSNRSKVFYILLNFNTCMYKIIVFLNYLGRKHLEKFQSSYSEEFLEYSTIEQSVRKT